MNKSIYRVVVFGKVIESNNKEEYKKLIIRHLCVVAMEITTPKIMWGLG